jgi:KUP system potassium uptake protein
MLWRRCGHRPHESTMLDARHHGSIAALGFAALGVVFGDIGTSPLYTLKTMLDLTGDGSPATVLGVLSLIVWTLIVITSVKYVTIAMRVDNDGEGGILALMALLGVKRQRRPGIVALGLFGAALIYGDGAIGSSSSPLPRVQPELGIGAGLRAGVFSRSTRKSQNQPWQTST